MSSPSYPTAPTSNLLFLPSFFTRAKNGAPKGSDNGTLTRYYLMNPAAGRCFSTRKRPQPPVKLVW